jgi:CheY-like chemotaxis protein
MLELLVVFIGVSAGFLFDSFREDRSDRKLEVQYLESLYNNILADSAEIRSMIEDDRNNIATSDKTILIIEDNAYVQDAFELTLQTFGLKAMVVTTAEEALEAVYHRSFDIIISDHRLPGMDGLEFFNVAASYITESTKVLTSAYGFEEMGTDARTACVDHFAVKPFSIPRLLLQLTQCAPLYEGSAEAFGGLQ